MSNNNGGYSDPKTQAVLKQVEDVKAVMQDNIQNITKNQERVEDLQMKSEKLADTSKQFNKGTKELKRNAWWKNMKLNLIIAAIIVLVLIVIICAIAIPLANKAKKN